MTDWSQARPEGVALPEWYRKAKLGLFVHWGAYSVSAWGQPVGELGAVPDDVWYRNSAYAEWYYNTIRFDDNEARAFHREQFGDCDYYDLLDMWTAEAFDAEVLLKQFRAAGAGYAVITTKHHDGITLWEASNNPSANTVTRGPKRDLVKEFGDACRRSGVMFGTYYSGGLDWLLRPMEVLVSHDDVDIHGRPKDKEYADYAYDQLKELIDRYRPSMLWNDIDWPDAGKHFNEKGLGTLLRYFYTKCPEGVINDRWGGPKDYETSEYSHRLDSEEAKVWEHTRGIGLSFGYNQNETEEHTLSPDAALRELVDIATRGGKLLLNVGLHADGTVPELQQRVLDGLTAWHSLCGSVLTELEELRGAYTSDDPWVRSGRVTEGTAYFVDHDSEVTLDCEAEIIMFEANCSATLRNGRLSVTPHAGRVGPAAVVVA